jgi:hypothetical protein
LTGPPTPKTVGIVVVAALAANAGALPPVAAITSTCRPIKSFTARQSIDLILAQGYTIDTFSPST